MLTRVRTWLLVFGLCVAQLHVATGDEPLVVSDPVDTSAPASVVGQYHSPTLQASFIIQYMYITTPNGSRVMFWGARITDLDASTPLNSLGLRKGDVITRLDGVRVADGAHQDPGPTWHIPEMERHFALTEVRYIITGTNIVRVGTIDLGPLANGPHPLQP